MDDVVALSEDDLRGSFQGLQLGAATRACLLVEHKEAGGRPLPTPSSLAQLAAILGSEESEIHALEKKEKGGVAQLLADAGIATDPSENDENDYGADLR